MTQICKVSLVMAERYLVVGAGITGAYTASFLKRKLPNNHIELWEKSRGSGGRMSTSRQPDGKNTVDLGAQYISATPYFYDYNKSIYHDLIHHGVLKSFNGYMEGQPPYQEGTKHFVATHGISSIAKYILKKHDVVVKFNKHLTKLNKKDDKWEVSSDGGDVNTFDYVILTMPVPQILGLKGDIQHFIDSQEEIKTKLKKVSYSSRFVIGLFYDNDLNLPWVVKYVNNDPVVRFISVDDKKRDAVDEKLGSSLCVHSCVPFALKHIEEDKDHIGMEYLLPAVQNLLPNLPDYVAIKCHKWKFSQVYKGYSDSPSAISLDDKSSLLLGGDAFTKESKFDNCIQSSKTILKLLNIE